MNPIDVAIQYIKREIPSIILNEVFTPRRYDPARTEYYRDNALGHSLEHQLEALIVRGWVGLDLNLCSGTTDHIDLSTAQVDQIDPWNRVYTIPDRVTAGRTITSTYGVSFSEGGYESALVNNSMDARCGSSEITSAARGVLDSHRSVPMVSTARVQLVGHNIVLISDNIIDARRLWLHCQLTHEPDFTNISAAYRMTFGQLAALAAKAYIYRELPIQIEEGMIRSGGTISRVREYVDGYSDALTMYYELLEEKWKVQGYMNDKQKHRQYLTMIAGGWSS